MTILVCSVAYSANIGGTGTIIGTPPNLILMDFLTRYPGQPLNFGSWLMFSLPDVLLNLLLLWLVLQLYFLRPSLTDMAGCLASLSRRTERAEGTSESGVSKMLREKYRELGPITFHEVATVIMHGASNPPLRNANDQSTKWRHQLEF